MTPDELKREEEVLRRILQRILTEFNGDTTAYFESVTKRKPTPKTVEAREWEAYVSQNGVLYDKREISKSHQYLVDQGTLKPIRVREVIDTPKEPKERREFKSWIKDTDDRAFPFRSQKSAERWKQDGYRLATLVEKGGGE